MHPRRGRRPPRTSKSASMPSSRHCSPTRRLPAPTRSRSLLRATPLTSREVRHYRVRAQIDETWTDWSETCSLEVGLLDAVRLAGRGDHAGRRPRLTSAVTLTAAAHRVRHHGFGRVGTAVRDVVGRVPDVRQRRGGLRRVALTGLVDVRQADRRQHLRRHRVASSRSELARRCARRWLVSRASRLEPWQRPVPLRVRARIAGSTRGHV